MAKQAQIQTDYEQDGVKDRQQDDKTDVMKDRQTIAQTIIMA